MTIKKRLFWSNILMILVPVIAAASVGLACVGFIWLGLIKGAGLGLHDQEDFSLACSAATEGVEACLKRDLPLSSLESLLAGSSLSLTVRAGDEVVYSYGEGDGSGQALAAAAELLGNEAVITQDGRGLYVHQESVRGTVYTLYLSGAYQGAGSYSDLKTAAALSAVFIAFTIFLSILLTNRFLTRFVLRRIEEPLDILSSGVHELRDGNLDCRIAYDRQDEFAPVCEDFNEMAVRLKESVCRIQQQEQSRRELVAGMSHDIRSPLTSIQAYVEGLLDGVARTPAAQKRYLETIKTKAEDLERMVSRLFLFSKMELGEYPQSLCELRLDQVISDTVAALEEEYRQKGLVIEQDMEAVKLYADPVQIQRITTNILENSLKYRDKAHGCVQITLRKTEAGCRLSFADDGPGVAPESLPHLFEVFYRGDPARQNPHEGSGLGLAIVANAVKQSGGQAAALPSPLGGLEIQIYFPSGGNEHGQNSDCGR